MSTTPARGKRLHGVCRRAGNRLRQVKPVRLLRFAEVGGVEELLQADDLGATGRRLADELRRTRQIGGRISAGMVLDDPDSEWAGHSSIVISFLFRVT